MHKLTARTVSAARFEGKSRKLSDGGGLRLHITRTARTWRYAYRHLGREKTYTIGPADTISLAEARERHREARLLVGRGVDPVAERVRLVTETTALAQEKAQAPMVGDLLDEWLERKKGEIDSGSRTESNLRQLGTEFRGIRVAELKVGRIITELQSIAERCSADMAHRVLGNLRSALDDVLDDGSGEGLIRENRARSPLVEKRLPPRERTQQFKHMTKPHQLEKVLTLIERHRHGTDGNLQVRALMWLQPRLFTRPGELRTIRWSDVNFEQGRLEIDGASTKSGRPFLVPLAKQCLALFRKLEADKRSDYVFYSPKDPRTPLSDGALRPAMRRAGIGSNEIVPHGFRHTASTMLNEQKFDVTDEDGTVRKTRFRPDAIEAQLSHVGNSDKVRAVYNRAEYLDERAEMMQAWADWLDTLVEGERDRKKIQKRRSGFVQVPRDLIDARTLVGIDGRMSTAWSRGEGEVQA